MKKSHSARKTLLFLSITFITILLLMPAILLAQDGTGSYTSSLLSKILSGQSAAAKVYDPVGRPTVQQHASRHRYPEPVRDHQAERL